MPVDTYDVSDVVIWSADVDTIVKVVMTLAALPERIRPKIDRLGQKKMGEHTVAQLSAEGFEVFDDAKIVEIPEKMEGLAEEHCKANPWMLNCMAGGVSNGVFDSASAERKHVDGLKRFADVCHSRDVLPCGVTVLTSKTDDPEKPDESIVRQEFNGRNSVEQVLVYANWLAEAGFTDLVCSTAELAALEAEGFLNRLNANVPGIRLPESDTHDQARVGTPRGALQARAKRLVIGRDITSNPVANYARIAANIRNEAA